MIKPKNYTEGPRTADNGTPLMEEIMDLKGDMILTDFIDTWLEVFKANTVKAASLSRLNQSRRMLASYPIASKRIGDISFFDIQKYVNELVAAGYAMSGLKKQVLIVTAPLKQAAAMKIISADPSVGIRLPKAANVSKKTKEVIAYTSEEQDKLFAEIDHNLDSTGYIAVRFMIETGLRVGELLALKWSDIDIPRSRLHVHATLINYTKTSAATYQDSPKSDSSNRIIPITAKAKELLDILKSRSKTEWVFEQDRERYSYKQLMYQTKKLCRVTGVAYYGEHTFRHTFATNCYYKGIDVKVLSKLLGHSSVQVTYNTYINLYGDGFDDMYAALCI